MLELTTRYTLALFDRYLNRSTQLFPEFPEGVLEFGPALNR
jgi:hypothetical protein